MPRINPQESNNLDTTTAATLDAVRKSLGVIPNLFSTLAHAPAALNAYLGLNETLTAGELTAEQREIIALTVAQYNQCQYCLSAHSLMGKGAGLSEDDIRLARNGGATDGLNHNIAAFARDVTEFRGVVPDESFKAYLERGLTHALMIEIAANVALNLFSNYTNHLADTEIDFPVVALAI